VEWSELLDRDGPALLYVEGTRDGLPIADLARVAPTRAVDEAADLALARLPGWLLATEDEPLARALLQRGATQVRQARVMTVDTSAHRAAPVLDTVPRSSLPVREFLPGWRAAYPAGHPDHEEGSDDDVVARCWEWYDEPEWLAREHRSSGLVVRNGRVVAGIIISLRPQPVPYGGPWVHDVWVTAEARGEGLGSRLLDQAMRLLDEDGLPTLGLAVSEGNPARGTYERLGFTTVLEAWTVHLPPKA
jgi:ribosomal protein S18 acetylase RimI-like enzyme